MSGQLRPDIKAIVDDIFDNVVSQWSKEDQDEFLLGPYLNESLSQYHMNFGMWIRNHYKLWTYKWEPELKDIDGCVCDCSPYHPDQLSSTIIEEVWKKGQRSE